MMGNSFQKTLLLPPWNNRWFFLLAIVSMVQLLSVGCSSNRFLNKEKGERLLVKNDLKLISEGRLNNKSGLKYDLNALIKQQPNSKFLGIARPGPSTWLWYSLRNKEGKFADWTRRKLGAPPAILDSVLTERSKTNIENHLHHKGFLQATCSAKVKHKGKKRAKVRYDVEFGPQFFIDSVELRGSDTALMAILRPSMQHTLLKRGGVFEESVFQGEKTRITKHLKNSGYAFFAPSFIEYEGDTIGTKVNVVIEILVPEAEGFHRKMRVENIKTLIDFVPEISAQGSEQLIDGVYFASSDPSIPVKLEVLRRAITIRPGQLYNQDLFDDTVYRLNRLGIYRFVSIRPAQDSSKPESLDLDIKLSSNKRLTIGGDLGLNTTNNSIIEGWLLGFGASTTFTNRNLLRGAELLQTSLRYNVQLDLTQQSRFFNSQEIQVQNTLAIPRLVDYLGIYKGILRPKSEIDGKDQGRRARLYEQLRYSAQTKVNLSYNYLNLIEYLSYNIFHVSYGYDFQPDAERKLVFDNLGLDLLRPTTGPLFDLIADQNPLLRKNFGDQLFTGFFFRSLSFNQARISNLKGIRTNFRFGLEVSGAEVEVLNALYNGFFSDKSWTVGSLEFSRFSRIDADFSFTKSFTPSIALAGRVGSGIARPFGAGREVPFVKQFFVGGANSLRGWRIRQPGPGGWLSPDSGDVQQYYQTGDLRLEANIELRFPLFYPLKGAIFVDAGNVWLLDKDTTRPLANLRWDSYKDIAVNTGFGIRGDFDYFVLRFDVGMKMRQPFADSRGKYWFSEETVKLFNPNLAVGYPF